MNYYLGIDIGTSSTKIVIINEYGKIQYSASGKYQTKSYKPGWAEQDPQDWWNTVLFLISKIKKNILRNIKAVSITGQMHGTVLLDNKNKLLRDAIIWLDRRSSTECNEIFRKIDKDKFLDITCNRIVTGWTLPTLLWLKKHERNVYRNINKFVLPKDYIRYKLTGVLCSDPTEGCGTGLMNTRTRKWSDEIIDSLGLDKSIFPDLKESIEIIGELAGEVCDKTGLSKGIPVICGGSDQATGCIGIGLVNSGIGAVVISTGGQVITCVEEPLLDSAYRLHLYCHAEPGKWFLLGATLSSGLSLDWFMKNIIGTKDYARCLKMAACGSEWIIFLPYLAGERTPHMDPYAKGVFIGLSSHHNKYHMLRSVLEGVTFSLKDTYKIFMEIGVKFSRLLSAGGGAKNILWQQLQADIFEMPIYLVNGFRQHYEHSAYGSAILSMVGLGVFKSIKDACKTFIKYQEVTRPVKENITCYRNYYKVYRSLYKRLKSSFREIDKLVTD